MWPCLPLSHVSAHTHTHTQTHTHATSVLGCRYPAEFSSSPNQTHLNKLIKVFRITSATGRWGFFLGLELNSAGNRHSRTDVAYPWYSVSSSRSRESSLHQLTLSWSHLPIRIRHLSRHSYTSSIQFYSAAFCLLRNKLPSSIPNSSFRQLKFGFLILLFKSESFILSNVLHLNIIKCINDICFVLFC